MLCIFTSWYHYLLIFHFIVIVKMFEGLFSMVYGKIAILGHIIAEFKRVVSIKLTQIMISNFNIA